MNILITVSVRWWNANAYYAISLAEALSNMGHKVYVAGDPDYPPTIRAKDAGLEILEIRFASFNITNLSHFFHYLQFMLRLVYWLPEILCSFAQFNC